MNIRPINPSSEPEIELVASRMKLTLIDVLGAEKGESYYSDQWLLERVQFHISLKEDAQIFLSEDEF